MQRFPIWRMVVVGVLAGSVLAASSPCGWMVAASSSHKCCQKRARSVQAAGERCHDPSISSCCAENPQSPAVVPSVVSYLIDLAPQALVHDRTSFVRLTIPVAIYASPSSYLLHSVLRI